MKTTRSGVLRHRCPYATVRRRQPATAGSSTSVTTLVQRRERHRRVAACPLPACHQWLDNAGAMAVRRRRVNRCAATAGASTSVTTLVQRRARHRRFAACPTPVCRQWPDNAGAMDVRRRRVNRCAATAGAPTSVTTLAQRRMSHRRTATSPPPLCPRARHHRRRCHRRATGAQL